MANLNEIANAVDELAAAITANTVTVTAARRSARPIRLALRSHIVKTTNTRPCPAGVSCFHSLCNAHAYLRLNSPDAADVVMDLNEAAALLRP